MKLTIEQVLQQGVAAHNEGKLKEAERLYRAILQSKPIHPDANQARTITVREAGLLQSFPLDYEFVGSKGACYKMIGNAVPPKMAKGIAVGIAKYLKNVRL